jgi:hypothetical protein
MFKFSFSQTKFWLFSQTGIHTLKPLGTLLSKGQRGKRRSEEKNSFSNSVARRRAGHYSNGRTELARANLYANIFDVSSRTISKSGLYFVEVQRRNDLKCQ